MRCDAAALPHIAVNQVFVPFSPPPGYIITALWLRVPLSPTKITLIGAVLFALQQTRYLPLHKHHLMLLYTVFTVVNKVSAGPAARTLRTRLSAAFMQKTGAVYLRFMASPASGSKAALSRV